ncbi:mediator complex subunit MED14-domain-containing protein [Chytridium lagenaria]|nr:mediator complex subunit MED14-domain-containing protein [Chytridium lagenaria]
MASQPDYDGEVSTVTDGMVPLKEVLDRMIQQAFGGLQNMSETLPSSNDLDKKTTLLRYTTTTRSQFMKLLVLFRWSKIAQDMQKVQNLLVFLEGQDMSFVAAADGLVRIHGEMKNARNQNYDVVTAIDVLTTGHYHRLPSIIKKTLIGQTPLTRPEIIKTISFLEQSLYKRLLFEEVIPIAFRNSMRIENGSVLFTVPNEFEVSLTLQTAAEGFQWEINFLNILVNSGVSELKDVTRLQDHALRDIAETARQKLRVDTKEFTDVQNFDKRRSRELWPLVSLFDHLHLICLKLQLEILKIQAGNLLRTRWKDRIICHYDNAPKQTLSIQFWAGAQSSVAAMNLLRISIHTVYPQDSLGDNISLLEAYTSENLAGPLHCISATLSSGSLAASSSEDIDVGTPLDCNLSSLNLESLLVEAAEKKGREIILNLYAKISDCLKYGDLTDVELVENNGELPSIRVLYRPNHFVKLDVNVQSGNVVVSYKELLSGMSDEVESGSEVGKGIGEKMKVVEEMINRDPECAGSALLNLRRAIRLNEIEAYGAYLGLESIKAPHLDDSMQMVLGSDATKHITVFGIPQESWTLIAVGICSKLEKDTEQLDDHARKTPLTAKDFYKIWFLKLSRSDSGSIHISSASPLPMTVVSESGASAVKCLDDASLWNSMDMDHLSAVVVLCRRIPINYSYILRQSDVHPKNEFDEGAIASKNPLIFVRTRDILKSLSKTQTTDLNMGLHVDDETFPGIFISINHVRLIDTEEQQPKPIVDIARSLSGLSSFRVTAKLRLRSALLPPIICDENLSILSMQAEPESLAIGALLKKLLHISLVSCFAGSITRIKTWCNNNLIFVPSFNLTRLDIEISSNEGTRAAVICISCGDGASATDDFVHVKYSLMDDEEESEFVGAIGCLLQKELVSSLDIVVVLQRAICITPLARALRDLERKRKSFTHGNETTPLIRIHANEKMWIRLIYGHHGIDFQFLKSGLIGLFDSFYTPRGQIASEKAVEYFSDMTETLIPFPHLVSQILDLLSSTEAPQEATVLPLPHGVILSPNLITEAFTCVERLLENIALVYFIYQKAQTLPDFDRIQFQPSNLRIMFSVPIGVGGLIGNTTGGWKVKLVLREREANPGAQTGFRISQEDLNLLVEKINTLRPESGDYRSVLSNMIDFIVLPHIALNDLAQIIKHYERSMGQKPAWRMEWCLNVPEGAPEHLPPVRSPATIVERDKERISVVFRFFRPGTSDPPIIVALRFNYATKIVGLWRGPEHDESDLTLLPPDSHTEQRLLQLTNDPDFATLPYMDKLLLQASARDMPVEKGGPGKLFIIIKALCMRPAGSSLTH